MVPSGPVPAGGCAPNSRKAGQSLFACEKTAAATEATEGIPGPDRTRRPSRGRPSAAAQRSATFLAFVA